jgi:uncharacterized membrane protein YgcG
MGLTGAAGFTEEDEVAEAIAGEVFACEVLACEVLARRDVFRRGLVCLATLSHSARSSSLSTRLRGGGGSGRSGIDDGTRRFIGGGIAA